MMTTTAATRRSQPQEPEISTAGSSFPALLFLDSSFPYPLYMQLYAQQILLIKFITSYRIRS